MKLYDRKFYCLQMIVMSPKSLLRHPEARSPLSDFTDGTTFRRLIPEEGVATNDPNAVKKLIFCTGKVYYDLTKDRTAKNVDEKVAIARVEQVRTLSVNIYESPIF